MNLNKSNFKEIRRLILYTVVVVVVLWKQKLLFSWINIFLRVLTPFLVGGGIALILNIPMSFYERKLYHERKYEKKKWMAKLVRPVSFILALISVVGVISIVMVIVIPELGNTVKGLGNTLQAQIPKVQAWAQTQFENNPKIAESLAELDLQWDKVMSGVGSFLKSGAGNVLDTTYGAAKSILSALSNFVIAFVFACYLLLQKERLSVQVRKMMYAFMPQKWADTAIGLGVLTKKTVSRFVTGQCVEAVIVGSLFFVAMSLFNMPYAMLISVFIGFMALIPIFGAFIGCVIGALLILIVSPMKALGFVIMFLILQQLEGNLIYPHVVGNSVGLPSIWVLVAVSIGASLFGIVGMLLFIPITSVLYTVLRGIINRRLSEREIAIESEDKSEGGN